MTRRAFIAFFAALLPGRWRKPAAPENPWRGHTVRRWTPSGKSFAKDPFYPAKLVCRECGGYDSIHARRDCDGPFLLTTRTRFVVGHSPVSDV